MTITDRALHRRCPWRALCLVLTSVLLLGCRPEAVAPAPPETPPEEPISRAEVLRTMDQIYLARHVPRSGSVYPLARIASPIDVTYEYDGVTYDIAAFAERTDTTGLIVVHDGTILYEAYYGGADESSRFTSQSVAKSFVSSLVGIALGAGRIRSLADPVNDYLPEVAGTGYDGVTIEQLLQMSSGVAFVEEYDSEESDIRRLWRATGEQEGRSNEIALSFGRGKEPGTVFHYVSSDTQVLGMLLQRVTGQHLADTLSEKIWRPLGMEADATWLVDRAGDDGMEAAYCCLNVVLRDYARYGLLMARDGIWEGEPILPPGWVERATRPRAPHVQPGELYEGYPLGYGYQWWTFDDPDHTFTAEGIYGQLLWVEPVLDLVVVKTSAWPVAWDNDKEAESYALFEAIAEQVRRREMGPL